MPAMIATSPSAAVDAVQRMLKDDVRGVGVSLFVSVYTGVAEPYFAGSDIAQQRERDQARYMMAGTYRGTPSRLDILRDLLATAIARLELLRKPPLVRHHPGAPAHE